MLLLTILSIQQNSGYTTFHRRYIHISSDSLDGICPTQDTKSWVGLYDVYAYDDKLKQTILTISTSVVLKKLPMESR